MTTSEKFTIDGKDVVGKVKEIIREGNVRRIRLIHADRNLIDIPLTVGASAAAITVLAAYWLHWEHWLPYSLNVPSKSRRRTTPVKITEAEFI